MPKKKSKPKSTSESEPSSSAVADTASTPVTLPSASSENHLSDPQSDPSSGSDKINVEPFATKGKGKSSSASKHASGLSSSMNPAEGKAGTEAHTSKSENAPPQPTLDASTVIEKPASASKETKKADKEDLARGAVKDASKATSQDRAKEASQANKDTNKKLQAAEFSKDAKKISKDGVEETDTAKLPTNTVFEKQSLPVSSMDERVQHGETKWDLEDVIGRLGEMRLEAAQKQVRLKVPGPFGLVYEAYDTELQLPLMQRLIEKDLSEPYSIFTYRYFLNNWPDLCFLAMKDDVCVGTIICKLGMDKKGLNRGYIAMLAVDSSLRKMGIGSTLVQLCIEQMRAKQCDVVVLETELTNSGALALYEKLGFVRDKRLMRYYLNGVDAFRLKLWLTPPTGYC